jgi:hypothetical protein
LNLAQGRGQTNEVAGAYKPAVFVDEIGLTSDKYIPLNSSTSQVPLTLSFGPLSVRRWLLMGLLEESLQAQTKMGFTEKDLDDVRRSVLWNHCVERCVVRATYTVETAQRPCKHC